MSTLDVIHPILAETYGETETVYSMASWLAKRIDRQDWDSRGREYMIMLACWDWFAGGTTADGTAKRIERALDLANDPDAHARDRENMEDSS